MYRVFRVLRDSNGNIVHKTPVGCARNERGARALIAGQWGECITEKYNSRRGKPHPHLYPAANRAHPV